MFLLAFDGEKKKPIKIKFEQDEGKTSERQTPVNPAEGLFGLRVATPPFSLLGLGGSQRGSALREELAPVIRELGPEMRDFGLQVRRPKGGGGGGG